MTRVNLEMPTEETQDYKDFAYVVAKRKAHNHKGYRLFLFGGDGGIRTHVPELPAN